jgi:hypothetical protein
LTVLEGCSVSGRELNVFSGVIDVAEIARRGIVEVVAGCRSKVGAELGEIAVTWVAEEEGSGAVAVVVAVLEDRVNTPLVLDARTIISGVVTYV